jgi:predicted RNA binding protein with dsRBD fold (UPF0201 family)
MAYTAEDEETVKKALIALATGATKVSFSIGEYSATFAQTDFKKLEDFYNKIRWERGLASGAYSPRTYARQGGRG